MSISSDEVNFIVYRYLQESGFAHSAFTFAHESLVARSVVADSEVPPGALLSFVQKGLQYVEIESHLQEDGAERQCDEPFYLLSPHICRVRPEGQRKAGEGEGGATGSGSASTTFAASDIATLLGHTSEVFAIAWSPRGELLASGGADATARVWRVGGRPAGGDTPCTVLRMQAPGASGAADGKPRKDKGDVAALDWHPDGSALATGCMDGRVRVWNGSDGSLTHTLSQHTGQIFDVQFNPSGSLLLSGSVDKTAVVWDVSTGEAKQQYAFHTAPILAVDWANETTFATCSTDKLIQVCTVGERTPTRTLAGHTDEINSLHWGSAPASGGRGVLASGSDDGTVRLWQSAASDTCLAVCSGHKKSVYAVRWAPTGEGSANPGKPALLASASFDGDIRLWDPSAPVPTRARSVLSKHSGNVYSVAWSPDGEYLASVASDKAVHVWSARDGALVRTLAGPAAGFQVAWSAEGGKLAACFANGALVTMDMRM